MTLREEIAVYLVLNRFNNDKVSEELADEILQLFEKKIDEKIGSIKDYEKDKLDQFEKWKKNGGYEEFYDLDFYPKIIKILEELKQEINEK